MTSRTTAPFTIPGVASFLPMNLGSPKSCRRFPLAPSEGERGPPLPEDSETHRPSNCRGVLAWLLSAALAIAATGCRLAQPGSASFASVVIANRSLAEIQEAAGQVFREDGYAAYLVEPGQMVFQKEGSRLNNISQSGLVDTYYGAQTMIRVRAQLVPLGAGSFRLQCQAYMVRNAGDSFFEDEHPLAAVRRMPYQRLLNQVLKRLKAG